MQAFSLQKWLARVFPSFFFFWRGGVQFGEAKSPYVRGAGSYSEPAGRCRVEEPGTDQRAGELEMPPGGGRGGEDVCVEQRNPPASGHRRRDMDAPSHSWRPFPSTEISSKKKKKQKRESQREQQQPAVNLPEGPLVNILSRVPYKSLCHFKCVSKSWLALYSDPEIRKKLPQTISGFFYLCGIDNLQCFRNLSGRGPPLVDPSLPFLRENYEHTRIKQCCSGLLLCRCWKSRFKGDEYDYVVCNPATKKSTVLPPMESLGKADYFLGFDSVVPSCFVVLAAPRNRYGESTELAINSSETGQWTSMQSKWGSETSLADCSECVFLNGNVHLCSSNSCILTVDREGKAWRKIRMPHDIASIGQSQGQLYAWHIDNPNDCELSVWVLEDYATGEWTLKLTVNVLGLFGRQCRKPGEYYKLLTVQQERNLIFLTDMKGIVSYNMVSRDTRVLRTCEEHFLGPAAPYIPCLAEW